ILEEVFEDSWAFLDDDQRKALTQLSVFEGGFSKEAAHSVAGADVIALGALERKCLVEPRGSGRFVLHPLIHDYARRRLTETQDDLLVETRRRHSEYFLGMVSRRGTVMAADQGAILDELESELPNVRAAWAHAVQAVDLDLVAETVEPIFYALA